jgi:hypothetical protein
MTATVDGHVLHAGEGVLRADKPSIGASYKHCERSCRTEAIFSSTLMPAGACSISPNFATPSQTCSVNRSMSPRSNYSGPRSPRPLLAHEHFRIEYSHVRDVIEVHVPGAPESLDEMLDILSQLGAMAEIRESFGSLQRTSRWGGW